MRTLEIHRGWLIERISSNWVARHPITAGLLVEAGLVGRYPTADQACAAVDRQLSPAFTRQLPTRRSASLYS